MDDNTEPPTNEQSEPPTNEQSEPAADEPHAQDDADDVDAQAEALGAQLLEAITARGKGPPLLNYLRTEKGHAALIKTLDTAAVLYGQTVAERTDNRRLQAEADRAKNDRLAASSKDANRLHVLRSYGTAGGMLAALITMAGLAAGGIIDGGLVAAFLTAFIGYLAGERTAKGNQS